MRELVDTVYAALRAGDADAIRSVLDDGFVGVIASGMPAGAGTHRGPNAMITKGWWAIGRAFAVFAEPESYLDCGDRLVVLGTYRGAARGDGHEVEAAFAHIWSGDGERLTALEQITDTARW